MAALFELKKNFGRRFFSLFTEKFQFRTFSAAFFALKCTEIMFRTWGKSIVLRIIRMGTVIILIKTRACKARRHVRQATGPVHVAC